MDAFNRVNRPQLPCSHPILSISTPCNKIEKQILVNERHSILNNVASGNGIDLPLREIMNEVNEISLTTMPIHILRRVTVALLFSYLLSMRTCVKAILTLSYMTLASLKAYRTWRKSPHFRPPPTITSISTSDRPCLKES